MDLKKYSPNIKFESSLFFLFFATKREEWVGEVDADGLEEGVVVGEGLVKRCRQNKNRSGEENEREKSTLRMRY